MRNKGTGLIFLGLLLIAAALFLTAYNLYDEQRAEQSALQVIDRLEDYLPSEVPTEASTEPIVEQAPMPSDAPDYVLGKFSKEELSTIEKNMTKYLSILDDFLKMSFDQLMSRYNSNK